MTHATVRELLLLAALVLPIGGCGAGVQGTYKDQTGAVMIDLKSNHQATFTFAGDTSSCTYNVEAAKLTLTCQGEKTEFTIHDDGSLTGPPGNLMGALRKTKS